MRPNLPNSISLIRVLLVPLLMIFMLVRIPAGDIVALIILAVAAGSDSLDGYLARRRGQTTVMGVFLDPLADKLLVAAALVSLVALDRLSAWIAMVVIAREFAVSGLRMMAAVQNVVISASKWGKTKTVSQIVTIAALIVKPRWFSSWNLWGHNVTWYLVVLMLVLTGASGIDYFVHARHQLAGHRQGEPGRPGVPPVGG
jgi:CDP-diacylglycerol---glycerol-3-phosphate 3-phosphatidyltransferase